ncbi:MAG: hypothetical protein AAFX51_13255 [Cyanobacteria bacterium J06636_28]
MVTLALVLLGASSGLNSVAFAQTLTLESADELAADAETLLQNQADLTTTVAALEQALIAYNKLNDLTGRIEVLERLIHIHEQACQLDNAIVWASEQLSLVNKEGSISPLEVVGWSRRLGELLFTTDQTDRLAEIYTTAERYLIQRQRSASYLGDRLAASWLWGGQADLVSSHLSFLPADSVEARLLAERLTALREQVAGIDSANNLYEDTIGLNQPGVKVGFLTESAQLSRQHNYTYGEMRALTILGNLAFQAGDYTQAAGHASRSWAIAEQMLDSDLQRITAIYLLAKSEQALGNRERAIAHYSTILTFQDAQNKTSVDAWGVSFFQREIIDQLASLYREIDQPETAARLDAKYRIETVQPSDAGSSSRVVFPPPAPQDPYLQPSRSPVTQIGRRRSPFLSPVAQRHFPLNQMCNSSEMDSQQPFGLPPIFPNL